MDATQPSPEEVFASAGGETFTASGSFCQSKLLQDFLSVHTWAIKDIPSTERLLGDLVTRTSRTFLVGTTGLGKTMFGLALACGMASGTGFLHWRSQRAARVLYIDGEMPAELIKSRCIDAIRRNIGNTPAGNLCIFARDLEEEFSKRFPKLGRMEPLNTEQGHRFIVALIEDIGDIDVVIFDNVMSLIAGDQKDEIAWSETMPLIESLTRRRVGQIWLDHTGHNTTRQYGSSTKAWRFDSVGIMGPLPEGDRNPHELAFTLSFDSPGKARRRTPDNLRDFERCTIRLDADRWVSDAAATEPGAGKRLAPMAKAFLDALKAAVASSANPAETTRADWEKEAVRQGLMDGAAPAEDFKARDARVRILRKYIAELKAAGWISVDGERVRSLRK